MQLSRPQHLHSFPLMSYLIPAHILVNVEFNHRWPEFERAIV
jgi:hypothetical protein